MTKKLRNAFVCLIFASSVLACGDDGNGGSADAAGNTIDAAGNQPDAAAGNPDASPNAIDAAAGNPDASPNAVDAAIVLDAAPLDAAPMFDATPPDAAPVLDANVQQITITQNVDPTTITGGISVSCNAAGLHADNRYFRVYDLVTDFGITSDFDITNVQLGIEIALAGMNGQQPIELVFHTLAGAPILANLTLVDTVMVNVADANAILLDIPLAVTIPAGSVLVVELHLPDGQAAMHSFFWGANGNGQNDPSYIVAGDCGITEMTTMGDVGFPDVHFVSSVTGNHIP